VVKKLKNFPVTAAAVLGAAMALSGCETDGLQQTLKNSLVSPIQRPQNNVNPLAGTELDGILARVPNPFPGGEQVGWPRISVVVLSAPPSFSGGYVAVPENNGNYHDWPKGCARLEFTLWHSEKDKSGTASQIDYCEPANNKTPMFGTSYGPYMTQSILAVGRDMQDPSSIKRTKGPKVPDTTFPHDGKTAYAMPEHTASHNMWMCYSILAYLGVDAEQVDRRVWFVNIVPDQPVS
jgi:hypothetical protein